jgi:prepilin-type processing-associated H-X9-DG protein
MRIHKSSKAALATMINTHCISNHILAKWPSARHTSPSGFTLIEALAVLGITTLLVALLAPAIQTARESGRRIMCANNLKQIGIALHNYHGAHGVMPFGCGPDHDASISSLGSLADRRYSAQSQILPYLDLAPLFSRIDFQLAPFHPYVNAATGNAAVYAAPDSLVVNGRASMTHVSVFKCPSDLDRQKAPWSSIAYRACAGSDWSGRKNNGMFHQVSSVRLGDITDGTSHTAMFSERATGSWNATAPDPLADLIDLPGLWTEAAFRTGCSAIAPHQAAEYPHNWDGGQTWLEGNMNWTRYNHVLGPNHVACKNGITWNGVSMTASSRHRGGVNVLLADGVVRFASENIDEVLWNAAGTISLNDLCGDW